jgi:hypothetical protein
MDVDPSLEKDLREICYETTGGKGYSVGKFYGFETAWRPSKTTLDSGLVETIVPLWIPTMVFVGASFALGTPLFRSWRRRRRGLCIKCGYDLTGNVSGVCPECGARIERPPSSSHD